MESQEETMSSTKQLEGFQSDQESKVVATDLKGLDKI